MFNTSISGLRGSQKYLDTTSNNISNANSYGFKRSRAEFADLYANSVFSSVKTNTGMGTTTTNVAQQFSQGSLSGDTGNNLDMAISGNGFFVLSSAENGNNATANGGRSYTRNGAFQINKDGFIVTAMGDYLQGYDVDKNGNATNLDITSTHAIQIPSDTGAPKMTSKMGMTVNLPANAESLKHGMTDFDHKDSSTFTNSTSQTVYDSLGGAHTITYYFVKDHVNDGSQNPQDPAGGNYPNNGHTIWNVVAYMGDTQVDISGGKKFTVDAGSASSDHGQVYYGVQLEFGTDGRLIKQMGEGGDEIAINFTNNGSATYPPENGGARAANTLAAAMGGGVDDRQEVNLNLNYTQYGSSKFSISNVTNDGYSTGLLENVEVDEYGVVLASYSNGRQEAIAMVAMANFNNNQGLQKIGDTQWKESLHSGEAQAGQAKTGLMGAIKGANLELSNVELATELVDLIIAQRSYQANAQALQTQNTAMDSIMNIR